MLKLMKQLVIPMAATMMLVGCAEKDESIVTIDGEAITESELHEKLVQLYGVETLDQLVSNKVIEMEAEKQNVTISEEAIDAEYAAYVDVYGDEEGLETYLETYRMTPEDVRYDIKLYLLTTALMEDYVAITEADVANYFEDNRANFQEEATLEDVREVVYEALLEERINEQYEMWIDEKYEEYEILTTFFEES